MSPARECGRHREALADLAERHEATPGGAAAIRHVSRCEDCAETLGELMLTVIALRRMAGEAAAPFPDRLSGMLAWPEAPSQPVDTAWTRLRDRIERSRRAAREQAWRWRTSLGGLVASALVVGALVGPGAIHVGGDPEALSDQQLEILSWQIETNYVSRSSAASTGGQADAAGTTPSAGLRRYPDDLKPPRKEVSPARATALMPDAR